MGRGENDVLRENCTRTGAAAVSQNHDGVTSRFGGGNAFDDRGRDGHETERKKDGEGKW